MARTALITLIIRGTLLLGAVAFGIYFLLNYGTLLPAPAMRSSRDVTNALLRSHPELFADDDQPIFTIDRIQKVVDHWYVVKIAATTADNGVEGYLVIKDPSYGAEHMSVVAGPESRFSMQELESDAVPDSIITLITSGRDD